MELREVMGVRIRALRKKTGLSQEKFADEIGLNRSHMGTIERGEANLCLDTLHKIAKRLGTTCSDLLNEKP